MIFLPALYAEKYGISLISIGIVIFFAKLIDIISDPIMGWLNDLGVLKRKTWMFIGALVCGFSIFYLFVPFTQPNEFYLGIFISLLYLGWTIFQVPFLSFGYDLEQNYHLRTRLSATREIFILMGLIASVSLPVVLGIEDVEIFISYLAIFSGIVFLTLFFLTLKEPHKSRNHEKKIVSPHTNLGSIFKDLIFLRLIVAWLINSLANVFPSVCFVFLLVTF